MSSYKNRSSAVIVQFCRENTILVTILVALGLPLAVYLSALTTCYLWGLFAVPLGAPVISLLHAWGLVFAARYVARREPRWLVDKPERDKDGTEHLADLLVASWDGICRCMCFAAIAYVAVMFFGPVAL